MADPALHLLFLPCNFPRVTVKTGKVAVLIYLLLSVATSGLFSVSVSTHQKLFLDIFSQEIFFLFSACVFLMSKLMCK